MFLIKNSKSHKYANAAMPLGDVARHITPTAAMLVVWLHFSQSVATQVTHSFENMKFICSLYACVLHVVCNF